MKPYVKGNKNDAADAEAICEAVARPNMRFVPIKTVEQQAVLSVHRVRQGFVKARTAQANQIRGLLTEFGLVLPQGITNVLRRVPQLIEGAAHRPIRRLCGGVNSVRTSHSNRSDAHELTQLRRSR